MKTCLLVDALEQPLHEGDTILDGSGRAYFVQPTENSFIRQDLLRVKEARLRRGKLVSVDNHTYVTACQSVKVSENDIPPLPEEKRRLYQQLMQPIKSMRTEELRLRHAMRRLRK